MIATGTCSSKVDAAARMMVMLLSAYEALASEATLAESGYVSVTSGREVSRCSLGNFKNTDWKISAV
jgi:hypothetical protein